jgi:archaellum biogenesis ATPase FlaH
MSDDTTAEAGETFSKMGKTYQEKVVQALLQDYMFAEQMADVIQPKYFDVKYLQEVVKNFYDHKAKYKTYPSLDVLEVMITRQDEDADPLLSTQVREYLERTKTTSMNGDKGFIEESSLDFCKKQSLKDGLVKAIDMMESGNYDAIQSVIKDALNRGGVRDMGHNYKEGFAQRGQKSVRKPIPTGWPILDKAFNGGWERATLSTFIAPTGAGKSMFLVNCGAAALEQGLNVLYVTLEMAEWKIGIRFDSYYSGVEINKVPDNQDQIKCEVNNRVRGELFIKEWPTKNASVQTIRAYLQRLTATKGFTPDMLVVDYADLLRGSRGYNDKRFELEGIYEELRALAQEFNVVVITADQTNRSGLDMEIVTIGQIGESYAKATVCDVIMTISRRMEDKQCNGGRLFLAKSRLGQDGMVYPFMLNTATVKVELLQQGQDPIALFMENNQNRAQVMADRYSKLISSRSSSAAEK